MIPFSINFPWLFVTRSDQERLQDLEDEQEELNGSLLALTNHFAQVKCTNMVIIQIHYYMRNAIENTQE